MSWSRGRLTLALVLIATCTAAPENDSRDLERPPARGPVVTAPPRHAVSPLRQDSSGRPCVGLDPAGSVLRGALRLEVYLGPPGYGETPAQDERDTVTVLALPTPLRVCGDTAATNAVERTGSMELRRFQLVGVPKEIWANVNDTVTAYGVLRLRERGWHFTPIVFWVDSIPDLKAPRQAPAPSASG